MADALPIVEPKEALQFFRQKGLEPSFAWQDVWQEEHVRSFTVAKAMSRDLLEDIRGEVDKAIANGTTLDDFRRELRPVLERKGWWGRKAMTDPLTGERKIVQLGSPRRLKTIFEVNMRSAYSAGRWERIQRVKAGFPFLRYVHSHAKEPRLEHLAWDGVIKPVGDPWWDTHFTPNGWGCKCEVVPVSDSMLERRGWTETADPPSFPKVNYTNPRTGEVTAIERGIDPGFNFNVGKAYLDSLAPRPIGSAGGAAPSAAIDAFLDSFGVDPKKSAGQVVIDRAGWPIAVSRAWFRTLGGKAAVPGNLSKAAAERELAQVGRAIVAPDEIRQVWVAGEDGEQMLVRRYLATIEGRGIAVDIGRAGWKFETTAPGAELDRLREGQLAWSNAGRGSVSHYIGSAGDRGRSSMRAMPLAPVSAGQLARLTELGVGKRPKSVALDASRVHHALRLHGADRRPGLALTAEDLAKADRIFNAARLSRGAPFRAGSVYRVHIDATVDGVRYGGAFEIRRNHAVVQTLYRK